MELINFNQVYEKLIKLGLLINLYYIINVFFLDISGKIIWAFAYQFILPSCKQSNKTIIA